MENLNNIEKPINNSGQIDLLVSPPPEIKGYIYSNQDELWGARQVIGFGDKTFYIKEIDRDLANDIIKKNHYSKKFYSATYIHLGVFAADELKGVLQYGYAMNPASQEGVVQKTAIDEYLELNRMWLDDCLGRNSESKAISYSIKYIKERYPKIGWIQSFADERCGKYGVVYQAANFEYYGEHTAVFWTLDNVVYHNILMTCAPGTKRYSGQTKYLQENKDRATKETLRQFRYIYWVKRQKRKNVVLTVRPYPKHYLEKGSG
ncbi:MAG: DNA modification protein [Ignavibacteria bacterium]|nr:MAG: DNA modification protein [Ignavibacteria bacterium]